MFKKFIIWLLCITLAIPGVGSILYFTVPKVKDYVNEKILKVEQISDEDSEDETDTENAELVASLQEEIASNKQVITNLNSELEKQRVEVTKLQNEAKTSEELINTLQTSINSKQAELDSIVAEKQALEQQKAEIQEEVNAKTTEIETLQTSITEKEQTISGLQTDIETKQAELETLKSEANADAETIANLESDIQAKQSELATLQAEAEEDAQTIATLEADIETKQAELEQLRNDADADAETIAQLESSIEEKQNLVNELQTIKENNETTIANLEADVTAKQNTITELQAKAEEDAATIEFLNLTISENQYIIDELSLQTQRDAESIESLQTDLINAQTSLNEKQDEINTKDAQIIQLDTDLNALEEERDTLLVTISEKNAEIETLQGNIATLEDEVSVKEVEIASLNEQIETLEKALEKDENKIYISDLLQTASNANINLTIKQVTEYEYLIYNASSKAEFQGVYLYNIYDHSVEQKMSTGYYLSYCQYLTGGNYLLSSYNTNYLAGLYFFDVSTKQIQIIRESGCSYKYHELLNGNVLCTNSSGSGNRYICLLDINTKTLTELYSVERVTGGSFLTYVNELEDGRVVLSTGNAADGALLFNQETNSISVMFEDCKVTDSGLLDNGNILCIVKNSSNTFDLYRYSTRAISIQKETSISAIIILSNSYVYLTGSSAVGSYVFDGSDNSLTQVSTSVYGLNTVLADKDGVVILSNKSSSNKIYMLKTETKEISEVYSTAGKWDKVEDDGKYVTISNGTTTVYYIYGTEEIITEKPISINFVNKVLDSESNVIGTDGGTLEITPSALKVDSFVTVSSEVNEGYYLNGIYADEELTMLVLDWLSGETTLNYSDISQYIDTETNTLTLYAVFLESDENSNPGQEGTGDLEGSPEDEEI